MISDVQDNRTRFTCFQNSSLANEIRTQWVVNGTIINETNFEFEENSSELFLDDNYYNNSKVQVQCIITLETGELETSENCLLFVIPGKRE